MEQTEYEPLVKDLSLMLLYLTSWEEKDLGMEYRRSWKGYPFEVLDELRDEDKFILGSNRSKSAYFTEKGIEKAKELLKEYKLENPIDSE